MTERQESFLKEYMDSAENGCIDKEKWKSVTRFGDFISYKKLPVGVKCFDCDKKDILKAPVNVQVYKKKYPHVKSVLYFVPYGKEE